MTTDIKVFTDNLNEFTSGLKDKLPAVTNEEITKTSLVLPFLHFLGYDIFNPHELQAEFTSELGINDEKIDYAILKDSCPVLLIEAKTYGTKLDNHINQLYKYYAAQTGVKICVLTDGIIYRFFADFDTLNVMDLKPFLEINLLKIKKQHIPDIMKLQKEVFDIDTIYEKASQLSYANKMLEYLKQQAIEPDYEFLRPIVKSFYEPKYTRKAYEKFVDLYKNVYTQYIHDLMNERFQEALNRTPYNDAKSTPKTPEPTPTPTVAPENSNPIITTIEELEAYTIIKSLVHDIVDVDLVKYVDTKYYLRVFVEKRSFTICLLYLERKKKSMVIEGKPRIYLDCVNDIYEHKEAIRTQTRSLLPLLNDK